jgi:hypothetical protein
MTDMANTNPIGQAEPIGFPINREEPSGQAVDVPAYLQGLKASPRQQRRRGRKSPKNDKILDLLQKGMPVIVYTQTPYRISLDKISRDTLLKHMKIAAGENSINQDWLNDLDGFISDLEKHRDQIAAEYQSWGAIHNSLLNHDIDIDRIEKVRINTFHDGFLRHSIISLKLP